MFISKEDGGVFGSRLPSTLFQEFPTVGSKHVSKIFKRSLTSCTIY